MPVSLAQLNRLANHISILPEFAPGYEWVTLERLYREPSTLIVGDELGAILLLPSAKGDLFIWHWLLTPRVRGAKALALGRVALTQAFTNQNINVILGSTPRSNRAARAMNRALGAVPVSTSVDCYGRECVIHMLERKQWEFFQVLSGASSASPARC